MTRCIRICGLALLLALAPTASGWAQDDAPAQDETAPADEHDQAEDDDESEDQDSAPNDEPNEPEEPEQNEQDSPDQPQDAEPKNDEEAEPAPTAPAQQEEEEEAPPEPELEPELEPEPEPASQDEWPQEWDDDAFDALGEDIDFVVEDFDDAILDRLTAQKVYPFIEYSGLLRVRSRMSVNFDLGTGGTSAVLPPLDSVVPVADPAKPDAGLLWTTDLRLRLAPTFHLRENLRIYTDFDFLRNIAFGDDPRHSLFFAGDPSPNRRLMSSGSAPYPVHVRQAYGELDFFFGSILAGRMLNHWGLGIFANDGNCADCDWGDQIDRLAIQTRVFDVDIMAAYDFPAIGLTSNQADFTYAHPFELTRLDTTRQWTLSASRSPVTRQDRELQAHRLGVQNLPVFNGGLYFSSRAQDGQFLTANDDFDQDAPQDPIYRGLRLYSTSPWFQFLWQPKDDLSLRVELEGLLTLGRVDNPTNNPVGFEEESGDPREVNCFDKESRENNPVLCTTDASGSDTARSVRQFGLALETEFDVGGPVSFGLNAGFATGGDAPNWGYRAGAAEELAMTRFNPDYHVDLILFREVIGTVTNAYYANPYLLARFLDTGLERLEFQLDFIGSRAFNSAGTPGNSPWLGLELDGSLRFIATSAFTASVDGGILFPMGGLAAVAGRERLNSYEALGPFTEDLDPKLAWTVQGRLTWQF